MRTKPFSLPPLLVISLATVAGMLSTSMVAGWAERLASPQADQHPVQAAAGLPADPSLPSVLPRTVGDDGRQSDSVVATPG